MVLLVSSGSCYFSHSGWGLQPLLSGTLKNTLSAGSSLWAAGRTLAGGSSRQETVNWSLCTTKNTGTCATSQVTRHSETQQEPMAQLEIPDYPMLRVWGYKSARSLLGDSQLKLFYCCTMIKSLKGARGLRFCSGKPRVELVRKAYLTVRVGWVGGQARLLLAHWSCLLWRGLEPSS